MNFDEKKWAHVINANAGLFNFKFVELWNYRDLLMLFVKRDIVTLYKQTILGPLWYLVQPIVTAIIFTLIFNNLAGVKTGEISPFLFNLVGVTFWSYFREVLLNTSDTFKKNEKIFGKVYFPRAVMPLSVVISSLLKFSIQFAVLVCFYLFELSRGSDLSPHRYVVALPLIVLLMGVLGLGLGMTISALVTKYRDLVFMLQFGVQMLMYLSLVAYPMSLVYEKIPNWAWLVEWNPLAHIIELSRVLVLDHGSASWGHVVYTIVVTVFVFLLGLLIFNKTERSFIDTV